MSKTKMQIMVLNPLDFFDEYTMTVEEWLSRLRRSEFRSPSTGKIQYMQAIAAVSRHKFWEWDIVGSGNVWYNPLTDNYDDPCFIFKISNNGTTFIVGKELPIFKNAEYDCFKEVEIVEI